jgi:hypothetical protein
MTETTHEALLRQTAAAEGLLTYFQGVRGDIEQDRANMRGQVNAFTEDVRDATFTRLYVNRLNGDDTASGTSDDPIASFGEAVSRAPEGGLLEIRLTGNMVMDRRVVLKSGTVHIRSDDTTVHRRIVFEGEDLNDLSAMPRFFAPYVGVGILFNAVEFVAGTSTANVTDARHMITCNGLTNVVLRDCQFEVPGGSDQALLGLAHGGGLGLHSTLAPTAMDGRWVEGVAAGTDPSTVQSLAWANNISSL